MSIVPAHMKDRSAQRESAVKIRPFHTYFSVQQCLAPYAQPGPNERLEHGLHKGQIRAGLRINTPGFGAARYGCVHQRVFIRRIRERQFTALQRVIAERLKIQRIPIAVTEILVTQSERKTQTVGYSCVQLTVDGEPVCVIKAEKLSVELSM